MREILFRAKRIDNGEWKEGYLVDDGTVEKEHYFVAGLIIEPYKGTADDGPWVITGIDHLVEIDPETLCQYTGLKDKNGNRIWENDIVRIENSMDEGIGNIEFYGGMWYVDGEPSNSLYDIVEYDDTAEVEVLGNIFDNPELLKGVE